MGWSQSNAGEASLGIRHNPESAEFTPAPLSQGANASRRGVAFARHGNCFRGGCRNQRSLSVNIFYKALLASATLSLAVGSAQAGLLGHSVEATYHFTTFGSVIYTDVKVVDAGEEFHFFGGTDPRHADLGDTTILARFDPFGGGFSASAFNGYSFFDVFATIDDIIGVTIDPSSTLPGFDLSRVTFDANRVSMNFQGLSLDANRELFVLLNLQFADAAVPITPTGALAALGLLGAVGLRRRQARRG